MDLELKMQGYKIRNRLRYLKPKHLKILFPDISIRSTANKIWRCSEKLCNPKRKQFKK